MYPKNAASPEPVAIGAVVQISDGAVQTSGVTVRIKPIGVAEGDGAGTTAYSTDGIVLYTPTQAETNYTSFILIAKKTGCIPVSVTVVTTASVTPGTVLLAPVTHTSATVPTVTTTTTATNVTTVSAGGISAASFAADVDAEILSYLVDDATRIDASALNTAAGTSIPAILDDTGTAGVVVASGSKTGYSLTATTGLGNQTADITGNLSGSVGSVTGAVGSVTGAINTAAGTIQTLDALDTAQDSQHTTTQGRLPAALSANGLMQVDVLRVNTQTQTAGDIYQVLSAMYSNVGTAALVRAAVGLASANLDTQIGTLATSSNLATVAGYLDTEIAAILEDTGTTIPTQISALNNISSANVLTQVNAALDTAIAELSAGAPTATPTTRTALMLLYMALRNRTTTTASAQTIQNDAGTTIATASLSDDGTTMTKGEFA